jgi:hypothetical protein
VNSCASADGGCLLFTQAEARLHLAIH